MLLSLFQQTTTTGPTCVHVFYLSFIFIYFWILCRFLCFFLGVRSYRFLLFFLFFCGNFYFLALCFSFDILTSCWLSLFLILSTLPKCERLLCVLGKLRKNCVEPIQRRTKSSRLCLFLLVCFGFCFLFFLLLVVCQINVHYVTSTKKNKKKVSNVLL